MKAVRALLLVLMLAVGHAHACHAVWRLPDGNACQTCPQAGCEVGTKRAEQTVTVANEDCRTCCTLAHCDDEQPDQPTPTTARLSLVMARTERVLVLFQIPVLTHDPVSAVVALHLPNAPPASLSARAPPLPLD